MKKLIVIAMLLCVGLTNVAPVFAMDTDMTTQTEATTSRLASLISGLKSLQDVPSYRVQMTVMNQRSHEKNAMVTMDVNQETGDIHMIFSFYNRKNNPKEQRFELYAYQNFSTVYTSALGWLQSMLYFKAPYFTQDTHAMMAPYRDALIPIEPESIEGQSLVQNLNDLALLLPNLTRLATANERFVHELDNIYFMNLHRIQIPEYLFKDAIYLGMRYKTNVRLNEEQAQLTQRLSFMPIENGLSYTMTLTNQLSKTYLGMIEGLDNERELPNLAQEQVVNTASVIDKLIDFKLVYNDNNKMYKLTLNGITENMDLNIFNDKTADFRTYEFQVDYTFKPMKWRMPEPDELKVLSLEELSLLMNRLINQEAREE
ncbi:hypothetical protein IU403_02745 [Aerococcaceae bacterium zg-BR22]|uniref:hypothetical protein n=1 Tax=Aerococcaceae bacterium zg-1292 TaxID=2774330 RepID=UPI004062CAE2|nr:hypothetical protein [Aerococcaceae bacterium zg-BR22]